MIVFVSPATTIFPSPPIASPFPSPRVVGPNAVEVEPAVPKLPSSAPVGLNAHTAMPLRPSGGGVRRR